ncbi:lsrG [Symbiodinium natans]|uniref:LsrG protein n=1 Tax=Symbiodinium natans TaxID=878477 RepID=A0A812R1K9_9DINO|nr:lsrG [Symbiodinium natans]
MLHFKVYLQTALVAVGTAAAHVEAASQPSVTDRLVVREHWLVTVEIKPDRIDDFLKVMEGDAKGSRDKAQDPGCLRFDLLRDRENPNKFVFYEAYTNDEAITTHKTTAHYKAWADFKATGAVESQTVVKAETTSLPPWAFQTVPTGTKTSAAVLVTVDIKAEKLDDFLKVMEGDAVNARDKSVEPNCLRFDLLKDKEVPNRFHFYEVYVDDAAIDHHRTTAHYKGWADFKAAGGVEKQAVLKLETASIPGEWALQP